MKSYKNYPSILTIFFVINLLLVFNSSCQQTKTKETKNQINNVKKDIPERMQTSKFRLLKENIENKLGIDSLENGFDSMQIRIGFANSSLREQEIILQNTNHVWQGNYDILFYNYDSTNTLVSIDKSIKQVKPISGWNIFIDSLFKLKILTLPDMSLIEGYEIGYDGKTITVEIATEDLYRVYSYWSPSEKSSFWQARNIVLIAKLLEKELGFKRFP